MATRDVNKPSKKGCHIMDKTVQDHGTCVVCVSVCVHVSACVFFVCLRFVCQELWWLFWGSLPIAVLDLVWIRWIIHCFCTNICPNLTEQSHVFLQFLFSWEKERTKCTACTCILNTESVFNLDSFYLLIMLGFFLIILWKRGGGLLAYYAKISSYVYKTICGH